jgi:cytoplasmic FMR1 interacting protein
MLFWAVPHGSFVASVAQSVAAPLLEKALHTLDVYNDAAHLALYVLNKQFLYDEIEAEVRRSPIIKASLHRRLTHRLALQLNLVFDQFSFLVSDDVYGYAQDCAASIVMDKVGGSSQAVVASRSEERARLPVQVYKRRLDSRRGGNWLQQPRRRFHVPMQQRHVKLLGRSIDLNRVIAQHVTAKLTSDLELALKVRAAILGRISSSQTSLSFLVV